MKEFWRNLLKMKPDNVVNLTFSNQKEKEENKEIIKNGNQKKMSLSE